MSKKQGKFHHLRKETPYSFSMSVMKGEVWPVLAYPSLFVKTFLVNLTLLISYFYF